MFRFAATLLQTSSLSFSEMIAFTNYLRNLKPRWAWKPTAPPNFTTYMLLLMDILGLFFLQSPKVRSVQGQPVHHTLNPTHSWTCLHFYQSFVSPESFMSPFPVIHSLCIKLYSASFVSFLTKSAVVLGPKY